MESTPRIYTTEEKSYTKSQAQQDGEWLVHHFKFEGRTYTLEKRPRAGVGPRDWYWYTCFAIHGKRYHRSLETNSKAAAEEKAIKTVIIPAKSGRLQELEESKLKKRYSTLKEVFDLYDKLAMISSHTIRNNKSALLLIIEWAHGEKVQPENVQLTEISKDLVRKFQVSMVNHYVKRAGADERSARDRALRSSRSLFNQAKSIFSKDRDLVDQYKSAGVLVPDCVIEFRDFKPQGKLHREIYFPPDDAIIRKTFSEAEKLQDNQPDVYQLFWLCIGTGMRRSEAAAAKWDHLVERDGRLWVSGGIGKDGKEIQIPVIHFLLREYTQVSPQDVLRKNRGQGFILAGDTRMREETIPSKLNLWLECLGWKDEKKMHALRAFVGSKIFEVDPRTAQVYLRHKSLTTTEKFYSHFSKLRSAVDRL